MFGFLRGIGSLIYNLVYPKPPRDARYGFRWRRGQGVPNALTIYDLGGGTVPAGVYVAFNYQSLPTGVDVFGRTAGMGTVYPTPAAPSAAVNNLVSDVRRNPPDDEEDYWDNVTTARLRDITGFLSYAANCLDLIDQTNAGHQLLQALDGGQRPVFITPAPLLNQTFGGGAASVNTLTTIVQRFDRGSAIDAAAIRAMVEQRYANVGGTLAKYNQLAADMNDLPLCSLFANENAFAQRFLYGFFRFRGARLTGQNLFNWLSDQGFAAFNANLRTFARTHQGVLVRQYFLLALALVLFPAAPAGRGSAAGVEFHVRNELDNVLAAPSFRPPAIGLAHELMHALHYTRGTAPGFDQGHFTTTAAELRFVGITPFQNEPISENQVRAQWNTIPAPGPDPSNVWAAPARRTTYEPPVPPETAQTMRARWGCI